MRNVIRVTDDGASPRGVAFNFEDMTRKGEEFLEQVRGQGRQLVIAAQSEAAGVRKQAEQEGLAQSDEKIKAMFQRRVREELDTLRPALESLAEQLKQARHDWTRHWEENVVHLAASIAKKVIRHELQQSPDISLKWIKESLELATGNPEIRLLLHPRDHNALGDQVQALAQEAGPAGTVEIVADPSIEQGGCRLITRYGSIDQQLSVQLARIEEELTQR